MRAEWLYELKFDGYRALIVKDGDWLQIISRNQKDLARLYPTVVAAGKRLMAKQAVVEGEIVALDVPGRDFLAGRQVMSTRARVTFCSGMVRTEVRRRGRAGAELNPVYPARRAK